MTQTLIATNEERYMHVSDVTRDAKPPTLASERLRSMKHVHRSLFTSG